MIIISPYGFFSMCISDLYMPTLLSALTIYAIKEHIEDLWRQQKTKERNNTAYFSNSNRESSHKDQEKQKEKYISVINWITCWKSSKRIFL